MGFCVAVWGDSCQRDRHRLGLIGMAARRVEAALTLAEDRNSFQNHVPPGLMLHGSASKVKIYGGKIILKYTSKYLKL